MKIIYSIVCLLAAFPLLCCETSNDVFLHDLCSRGAAYTDQNYILPPSAIDHGNKNAEQIKALVKKGSHGVLLILGPGPGNDLPLSYLVGLFQKVIMIDGYLDPMREWVERESQNNPSIREKVQLIQRDLSGGFYDAFRKHKKEIIKALSLDILQHDDKAKIKAQNYHAYLFSPKYDLSFEEYNADVIISSLVTSQITIIGDQVHEEAINSAFAKAKKVWKGTKEELEQRTKKIQTISDDYNTILNETFYYTALSDSKAQKIYFSDTIPPQSLQFKIYGEFRQMMSENYRTISSGENAWLYFENMPVTHASFIRKDLISTCSNCYIFEEKMLRCSKCKIKYCSRKCQIEAWPEHKKICVPK